METTWYFGFTDGDHKFAKYLKKGFSHVVAFSEVNGIITVVEPHSSIVEIKHYFMPDKNEVINPDSVAEIWMKDFGFTTVVEKTIAINDKTSIISIWNLLPTCVNCLKMVSAFKSKAQTPYGLYKSLMDNGGIQHGRFTESTRHISTDEEIKRRRGSCKAKSNRSTTRVDGRREKKSKKK